MEYTVGSQRALRLLFALSLPLVLTGCDLLAWTKPKEAPRAAHSSESASPGAAKAGGNKPAGLVTSKELRLYHGYALLYELMDKQSGVDKILILRNASKPTQMLVHQIAAACAHAKEKLDSFAKRAPRLRMDLHDLPEAEVDTRDAIEWATTKRLLLGVEFELKLLLTQVSATEYGAFLAQTLAERDPDKERRAWLKDLAKTLEDLNQKVVHRLAVKP